MTRRFWSSLFFLGLVVGAALPPSGAAGQGLLVDETAGRVVPLPRPIVLPRPQPPERCYQVAAIDINARVEDSVARVNLKQTFKNTGSRTIEGAFVFPLPHDAAIDGMTLLVDGKEYPGKLMSAEKARKLYEEIVRKNQDPALLEWLGTGLFRTSVFPIPAGESRTVEVSYTQVCRQTGGLAELTIPLRAARYTTSPPKSLKIRVTIVGDSKLGSVYAADHAVDVERPDSKRAVVTFEAKDDIPTHDFHLFVSSPSEAVGANVLSYRPNSKQPGYFLLLASPAIDKNGKEVAKKSVVFVVDRSGSMAGEKLEQAKGALKFVLNNLREGDTFNIVAYDSQVESFRDEIQKFDDVTRKEALGFVEGLFAGGSTNLAGALERALKMLQDKERPGYVVLLTDGLPTVGEVNEAKIVEMSKQANDVRARLFNFGCGYDVNSRLLDRLAAANHGRSEFVRPNEDIEVAVSQLYKRIEAPVLTGVELTLEVDESAPEKGPLVIRQYPAGEFDMFAGDQTVVVGRYTRGGKAKGTLAGKLGKDKQDFTFAADLVEKSDDDTHAFVARLWATRRAGEIIEELDLKGKNEELIRELVDLATEHGIVTQYTSFMADDREADPRDRPRLLTETDRRAEADLSTTDGAFGVEQRIAKSTLRRAARSADAVAPQGVATAPRSEEEQQLYHSGAVAGNIRYYDARNNRTRVSENLLQVGRKTFFRAGDRWIDSSITREAEQSARQIERFSREYFDLVDRHGPYVAPLLAIEGEVVVELGGEVYSW